MYRILSTALETIVAGVALGGLPVVVRRVQIALAAKDDNDKSVHLTGA